MRPRNKIKSGVGLWRRKTDNGAVAYGARAQNSGCVGTAHSMSAILDNDQVLRRSEILRCAKPRHQRCKPPKKKEPLESGLSTNQGACLSSVEHTVLFLSLDVEVSSVGRKRKTTIKFGLHPEGSVDVGCLLRASQTSSGCY